MLSRTAESLYWMARNVERADATARLIEMGSRMVMLPGGRARDEWRSVARVTGSMGLTDSAGPVTQDAIVATLILDPDESSSIRACQARARQNGRAVRTALTRDMWEALNEDWRRLETLDLRTASRDLPALLDWIKRKAMLVRGAVETSMLRNDNYDFVNLGTFVERADMMLRLLDVKYHVLLPETEVVGGGRDHHQWTSVLHATSAMRAYHHTYRGQYTPWRIADFLVLNRRFPRSVAHCYDRIVHALDRLAGTHGQRGYCHWTARDMLQRLEAQEMGEIFQDGLHEFVLDARGVTRRLSEEISADYHF